MKKTVGTADRVIRIVIAAVAIVLAFVVGASSAWGIILFIVAAVMVVTGSSAYCPLYSMAKINTLGHANKSHASR
ncbi:DUF2892 domain-containing protein [Ferrimicrobium sp.]|uniref:YgaP family membrane protein n=1 Tax=Ferrimicrobium sp. TaxID=2926050 RepID=UPI002610D0E6|nr:DUF2892 domain-containing protein [Ferrimicrobium sp.]